MGCVGAGAPNPLLPLPPCGPPCPPLPLHCPAPCLPLPAPPAPQLQSHPVGHFLQLLRGCAGRWVQLPGSCRATAGQARIPPRFAVHGCCGCRAQPRLRGGMLPCPALPCMFTHLHICKRLVAYSARTSSAPADQNIRYVGEAAGVTGYEKVRPAPVCSLPWACGCEY